MNALNKSSHTLRGELAIVDNQPLDLFMKEVTIFLDSVLELTLKERVDYGKDNNS